MRHKSSTRWAYLALAGIGLAAIPVASRLAGGRRRRHKTDHDSAPGHTARRNFGDYVVIGRSVTIGRPRAELFRYWRDFSNLPRFMENLDRVEPVGAEPGRNIWHIRTPAGRALEVETAIAREIEGELIAWRSVPGSDVETEGRVTFRDAPGDRGTRVGLVIAWKPAGGAVGRSMAKLFKKIPELQARHDLKRFKMLMETGEIAVSARTRDAANHHEREAA